MVPIRVDEKTGLAVVNVSVDGQEYPMTIDNGSAYTWIRKAVAGKWLAAHPEWERGQGAVGVSNMRMADEGMEAEGTVVRVSEMKLGTMILSQVGALAVGPRNSHEDMTGWYSKKNVMPVIGWLGGNVLQGFRITIDYEKGMSYWEKQKEVDGHDLDEVGLTLESRKGDFFVAAVAAQNGKPTVEGIQPGDKLVRIGDQQTQGMPWSKVLSAMHGEPGERREILVERGGKRITVEARVSRF